MMSPIKSLYGRRTTAGIINIPSVSGCGFLPNSATSFLLPGNLLPAILQSSLPQNNPVLLYADCVPVSNASSLEVACILVHKRSCKSLEVEMFIPASAAPDGSLLSLHQCE